MTEGERENEEKKNSSQLSEHVNRRTVADKQLTANTIATQALN